jgi:hypothetical protein
MDGSPIYNSVHMEKYSGTDTLRAVLIRYRGKQCSADEALQELISRYQTATAPEKEPIERCLLDSVLVGLKGAEEATSTIPLAIRFFVGIRRTDVFLEVLFNNINWMDPALRELWAQEIYTELQRCLVANPNSFSSAALDMIDMHCQPLVHNRTTALLGEMFSVTLVKNAKQLQVNALRIRTERSSNSP